jgi:hypothetical protein
VRKAQAQIEAGHSEAFERTELVILGLLFLKAVLVAAFSLAVVYHAIGIFRFFPAEVVQAFSYAPWLLMVTGCAAAIDLLVEPVASCCWGRALLDRGDDLPFPDALHLSFGGGALLWVGRHVGSLESIGGGFMSDATPPKIHVLDLARVYCRSFLIQSAWNFERGLNFGLAYALAPILRKLYDKGDQTRCFQRHMEYFNTQPYMASFIVGAVPGWRWRSQTAP